jgi:hypothetical protein
VRGVQLAFEHMKGTCRFAEEAGVVIIGPDNSQGVRNGGNRLCLLN